MPKISYYKSCHPEVSVVCGRGVSKKFPVHRHISISVGMVVKGSRALTINNNRYVIAEGDVFVINSGEAHGIGETFDHEHDYIVVSFTSEFIKKYVFDDNFWFCHIVENNRIADALNFLFNTLIDHKPLKNGLQYFEAVVQELADHCKCENAKKREDERLQRVCELIDNNSDSNMVLSELAGTAFLSRFHFARLFKQYKGLSPHRYLLDSRLRYARKLLEQGRNIGDIAILSGFYDTSHLVRHFEKHYGVSPLEYQKGMRMLPL